MRTKILLLTLTFIVSVSLCLKAQNVKQIKADRQTYMWGEGEAPTIKKADASALQMLVEQISVEVESKFKQRTEWGEGTGFKEKVISVINTYSKTTLNDVERMVMKDEPNAKIFRYAKRADVDKLFEQRKIKILDFVSSAAKALENLQIADALKYYYWASALLQSHPDYNEIYYTSASGKKNLLSSWLPAQMNKIFSKIKISGVKKITDQNNIKTFTIDVKYDNNHVTNFDYTYWDGKDWTNIVSAKDGLGYLEFYNAAADMREIKIKAEYIFEGETSIDREIEDVMEQIDPVPFRNSRFSVRPNAGKESNISLPKELNNLQPADAAKYKKLLTPVLDAIKNKQYDDVKKSFTSEGYDMFDKLMNYGNAKILADDEIKAISFNGKVICRSTPMSFSFQNNKNFIENVVFHFNEDNLIESIAFGLSAKALSSILEKNVWSENNRLQLISFMEHYKTAYALKRLNYIESIFADDAIIITGYKVKIKPNAENRYQNNEIIRYNRYTKQQYIKKMRYMFNSREYINLKFEESNITKGGTANNIYGVQIKQSYYSSNYGDVGYLFLIIDLNKPDEPIIRVRTWQPKKNIDQKNEKIYDLGDF